MNQRYLGLIAAAVVAGLAGDPSTATAQVSSEDAMPLATKFPPDAIVGEWSTQREGDRAAGRIKFVRADDGTYMGITTWSERQGQKDVRNPDPKLRDRPLLNIVIMWHLRYDDGEYVDGYVYNPEDGGTYRMKAEVLGPEQLKVRGYLGISIFGQTKVWSRFHSESQR